MHLSCETGLPDFDGKRAYNNLLDQCKLGPRNPGSMGHLAARKYIVGLVTDFADTVILQDFLSGEILFEKEADY